MDRPNLCRNLSKNHPRLFLTAERIEMLERSSRDHMLGALKASLLRESDALLETEATEFRIVGPRMLESCQQIWRRVASLALAFRISGDSRYLERAKKELFAAAELPHWNPEHFLDTAELCSAFATGYDWLYDWLSDADRRQIRDALVQKGLKPGRDLQQQPAWWVSVGHNWNTVSNGGLAIGALAVAEDEPELAAAIVNTSVNEMRMAQNSFAPDGAWPAGPHYWEYTAWYSALTSDALETALGTDLGLSAHPGFDRAGLFALHCSGPRGEYFNFGDSEVEIGPRPVLFWLGKRFHLANCIAEHHRLLEFRPRTHPFDLVWYQPFPKLLPALPSCAYFRGAEVVSMRTAWNDADAVFLGVKGGCGQNDHAHLDLGSFVFDCAGVRWASDLGADNYDLPGYWENGKDGERWKYFRLNNRSHNTLVLNDHLQDPTATARIVRTEWSQPFGFAIVDLSRAYSRDAASVERGVAVVGASAIFVQDEIAWRRDSQDRLLRWQMITDAAITVSGADATLNKKGQCLRARILSPPGATFSVAESSRSSPENRNPGYRQLIVEHAEPGFSTRITVQFSVDPLESQPRPLAVW